LKDLAGSNRTEMVDIVGWLTANRKSKKEWLYRILQSMFTPMELMK
jgi:hypothetical protein